MRMFPAPSVVAVIVLLRSSPVAVSAPVVELKLALIAMVVVLSKVLAAGETRPADWLRENRPEWALAGPIAGPRYRSISAIGNRVTAVTCRTIAGSAPAPRRVRCLPGAGAALRKFQLQPVRRRCHRSRTRWRATEVAVARYRAAPVPNRARPGIATRG